MTRLRTPQQNRRLHQLLNANGIADMKADLVDLMTDGRTRKSSELTASECDALIRKLNYQAPKMAADSKDRMRKKVIGLLREAAPDKFERFDETKGKRVVNMPAVYGWVRKYGVCNPKELNAYNIKELAKLVSQAEEYSLGQLK